MICTIHIRKTKWPFRVKDEFIIERQIERFKEAGVITDTSIGGSDNLAQVGCAYLNSSFSSHFRNYLEVEINGFGVNSMVWEEFMENTLIL